MTAHRPRSGPVYLGELPEFDRDKGFERYRSLPEVNALEWPDAVVEGWLFQHGEHPDFLRDYERLDLSTLRWTLKKVSVHDLADVATGPSEQDYLERVKQEHRYWLSRRPMDVQLAWETTGTWLVPPFLSKVTTFGEARSPYE